LFLKPKEKPLKNWKKSLQRDNLEKGNQEKESIDIFNFDQKE